MKITSDRAELDEAIQDARTTMLLLFGESNGAVPKIHDKAEQIITDPDWKTFWIASVAILSAEEKGLWYRADAEYTTLSRLNDEEVRIVKHGASGSLCLISGDPSAIAIKKAFTDAKL